MGSVNIYTGRLTGLICWHFYTRRMKLTVSMLLVLLVISATVCSPVPQYRRRGHRHGHHRPHHQNNGYNKYNDNNGFNNNNGFGSGGLLPFNGAGLVGGAVGFGLASILGK